MILFSTTRLTILTLTWFAMSLGGFAYWELHERTPGLISEPTTEAFNRLTSPSPGLRMMLFLHPHCSCSRATLNQLASCMSERRFDSDLCVYFVRPPGARENWEVSELRSLATVIPCARVLTDVDGKIARAYGVHTSGHLIVQDSTDAIRFTGGITPGRGNGQDCAGRQAVISLFAGELAAISSTPVFGCPLFESDSRKAGGD